MSIPIFPHFKPIAPEDREEIERLSHGCEPLVSDFCFHTLLLYDHEGHTTWSTLNGNLVVAVPNGFNPYGPYLTFSGGRNATHTALRLLEYAQARHYTHALHRVPEESARALMHAGSHFEVTEERDHSDYVYSIPELCAREGSSYQTFRRHLHRLERAHSYTAAVIETYDVSMQKRMEELLDAWLLLKPINTTTVQYARTVRRCFALRSQGLVVFALFLQGVMEAYAIGEVCGAWIMYHFAIHNPAYQDLSRKLLCMAAEYGARRGCTHLNAEEDGGDPGLRRFKQSCVPERLARKYRVGVAK